MKRRLELYYHTLRHLKPIQWAYRIKLVVKSKLGVSNTEKPKTEVPTSKLVKLTYTKYKGDSFVPFSFLNLEKRMSFSDVDWNYGQFGKLWTYNLNYFDFIHRLHPYQSLQWLNAYAKTDNLRDGLEPYPTALRLMNCIWFVSENGIKDKRIDQMIFSDAYRLSKNIEFHLLGNHVLEDAFAMCFAAIYFDHIEWKKEFNSLLFREWVEQHQDDGLHFEQSPMYHMILLERYLDLCLFAKDAGEMELIERSKKPLEDGLACAEFVHCYDWLARVNDASIGIASDIGILRQKARILNLSWNELRQGGESGYRKWRFKDWEVLMDLGPVGPSYQPGHAHADTFSFELYSALSGPIVVDLGTSTYQVNERRQLERSTLSHNTVCYAEQNSSDVWGGFRTARRANVKWIEDSDAAIRASHDGYRHLGVEHQRSFSKQNDHLIIKDVIENGGEQSLSSLHFHPSVNVTDNRNHLLLNNEFKVVWDGFEQTALETYEYAVEFNKLATAQKWVGRFRNTSKVTIIKISNS